MRFEFCGVPVAPLDLSPVEACGQLLPCKDHTEACRHSLESHIRVAGNSIYCLECRSLLILRDSVRWQIGN